MSESNMPSNAPSMNMLGTTKVGRVVVGLDMLRTEHEMMHQLLQYIIPAQVIYIPRAQCFEYLAISEEFDELVEGELVPLYHAQRQHDGTYTFVRQSFKRRIAHEVNQEIVNVIMNEKVNIDEFKEWIRKFTDATEEDFQTYDETFLEALNIYVSKRNKGEL